MPRPGNLLAEEAPVSIDDGYDGPEVENLDVSSSHLESPTLPQARRQSAAVERKPSPDSREESERKRFSLMPSAEMQSGPEARVRALLGYFGKAC